VSVKESNYLGNGTFVSVGASISFNRKRGTPGRLSVVGAKNEMGRMCPTQTNKKANDANSSYHPQGVFQTKKGVQRGKRGRMKWDQTVVKNDKEGDRTTRGHHDSREEIRTGKKGLLILSTDRKGTGKKKKPQRSFEPGRSRGLNRRRLGSIRNMAGVVSEEGDREPGPTKTEKEVQYGGKVLKKKNGDGKGGEGRKANRGGSP